MPTKAKAAAKAKNHPARWRKIFTPQIIIAGAASLFCIVMTIVCLLNPGTKTVSVTSLVENLKPLDAVKPKDRLVQQFTSDGDYVRFGLYYANFSNYIQGGKLHVDVQKSHGEVVQFTYDIAGAFDNSFLYIDYALEKDEVYTVTVYITDGAEGITFFTTTADNYHAKLALNKTPLSSSIIMTFVSETKDSFAAWYYVMALVLLTCYIVLKIDKDVYVQNS